MQFPWEKSVLRETNFKFIYQPAFFYIYIQHTRAWNVSLLLGSACRLTFDQSLSHLILISRIPHPSARRSGRDKSERNPSNWGHKIVIKRPPKSIGRSLIAVISAARDDGPCCGAGGITHTQGQRQIKNNDSISARVVVRRFHFIDKVVQRRSVSVANGIKILAARTAYTRAQKARASRAGKERNIDKITQLMHIDFLNVIQGTRIHV